MQTVAELAAFLADQRARMAAKGYASARVYIEAESAPDLEFAAGVWNGPPHRFHAYESGIASLDEAIDLVRRSVDEAPKVGQ